MDRGDGVGNSGPLGSGVCSGSQSLACSVGKKRQEVHPGVATLDGRVSEEEEREVRIAVNVKDRELMIFKWSYKWEERTGRRRWRSGVSYSPLEQTSHVSTPTWLFRSLLQLSILSIRSRTCVPMERHGGVRSSQSRTLLLLLLNWEAELGSSGHGPHFLGKV